MKTTVRGQLISVDAHVDSRNFDRRQKRILGDELPFANALALTRTAQALKVFGSREMGRRFDRPTPFTLKSLKVQSANKRDFPNQSAAVYFRDFAPKGNPAGRYLHPLIAGINRPHKGFEEALIRAKILRSSEYAVPGRNVKLDAYGNVRGSLIKQMLSQVKAGDAEQFETAASRERKRGKSGRLGGARYFVANGDGRLPRGVYRRVGRKPPVLLFLFVDRTPHYSKTYPFNELMTKRAARLAPIQFRLAFRKVVGQRRGL